MTRKKHGFGALDCVLLLLLAAGLALGGWLWWRERTGEEEARTYQCLMRVSAVSEELLEAYGGLPISVGDGVRNENGTLLLGRVESVSEVPHRELILRDGELILGESAKRRDLEITVRMEGNLRHGEGIRVCELRIAAGGTGRFRFGRYAAAAEILSVEVMGE